MRAASALLLLLLAACSQRPAAPGPCDAVDCGAGSCAIGADGPECVCNVGFRADGLTCVSASSLCVPNPCGADGGHTVCAAVGDSFACLCPAGEIEVEGRCVVPPTIACTPNACDEWHKTVCAISDAGARVCSCDLGFFPQADAGCGVDDCAEKHAGDVFEPDECPALAKTVDFTGPAWDPDGGALDGGPLNTNRRLFPATDVDWVKFPVVAGHAYGLVAETVPPNFLTAWVQLFEADGFTPSTGRATASGFMLGRISSTSGSPSDYALRLIDYGVDDHGDTPATATAVTLPAQLAANMNHPGDVDVFGLQCVAGHRYFIDGYEPDVIGSDGAVIDHLGYPRKVFYAPSTAPCFVRISVQTSFGYPFGYSLQIVDTGFDEAGRDHASAPLLSVPFTVDGGIALGNDTDYFAFDASAGHAYQFDCMTDAGVSCGVHLGYVAEGQLYGLANGTNELGAVTVATGRHIVIVHNNGNGLAFPYQLRAVHMGADVPGLEAPAPLLADGNTVTSRIDSEYDSDAFSFTELAGHTYRLRCDSNGSPCRLAFSDTQDVAVLLPQTPNEYAWKAQSTRELRAVVSSYGISPYALTLWDLGVEAGGDDAASAPLRDVATPVAGAIETPGDADHFAFALDGGTSYQITVATDAGAPFNVVVRDRNGLWYAGANPPFSFVPPVAQTYVLELSGPYGDYVLRVDP